MPGQALGKDARVGVGETKPKSTRIDKKRRKAYNDRFESNEIEGQKGMCVGSYVSYDTQYINIWDKMLRFVDYFKKFEAIFRLIGPFKS